MWFGQERIERAMIRGLADQDQETPAALRRTILIADDATAREAALTSVIAAGGEIVSELGWSMAPERLGEQCLPGAMVVEAAGMSAEAVADVLPRVDTLARTFDVPLIVTIDRDQIDQVAAQPLGRRVQLLCEPTLGDRVAALALAGAVLPRGLSAVHDTTSDNEAARLQRLNDEVARIADVLARLAHKDEARLAASPGSAAVADTRSAFEIAADEGEPIAVEAGDIRQVIRARRLRDQFFGSGLFEDPAWDMLLDLFAAELERIKVSVSSLCIAAAVAPTTALRWISKLVDAGLMERQPDPFDRRRAFMVLTDVARGGMKRYAASLKRAGLPFA